MPRLGWLVSIWRYARMFYGLSPYGLEAFNNRNKKPPKVKAQAKPPNVNINYISVKTEGEE